MNWTRRHLLDIESLSADEIRIILDTSRAFKAVGERDAVRPLGGEQLGGGPTNTRPGPGYTGDPVVQSSHCQSSFSVRART